MARLSKEDRSAGLKGTVFDPSGVKIDSIGPSVEDEAPVGEMPRQERLERAAHAAYTMHNVPKKWRGGGDYFFEVVAPGKLRITGGNKAKSLTGGKSVVITDRAKISEIFEKARQGDILEEGVSYEATAEDLDLSKGGLSAPGGIEEHLSFEKERIPGSRHTVESYGEGLEEELQEVSSPEDVGVPRLEQPEEPPGTADLGAPSEGLRPGRVHRNPHQEALEFLQSRIQKAAADGDHALAEQYDAAYNILLGNTEA